MEKSKSPSTPKKTTKKLSATSNTRKSPKASKLKLKTPEEPKTKTQYVNISDEEYQPASPLSPRTDNAVTTMLDIMQSVQKKNQTLNPVFLEDINYKATKPREGFKPPLWSSSKPPLPSL